jgi:hypothetical protein
MISVSFNCDLTIALDLLSNVFGHANDKINRFYPRLCNFKKNLFLSFLTQCIVDVRSKEVRSGLFRTLPIGVQSRNKCSLWNVERKEWAALVIFEKN